MTASSPRITARIDTDIQHLLLQATASSGLPSINAFVLSAAVEKATAIIDREQRLQLSQRDALALVEALDRPGKTQPRLQQAAKNYLSKTQG